MVVINYWGECNYEKEKQIIRFIVIACNRYDCDFGLFVIRKTSTGNEVVVNNNGNDYYLDAGIIVNLGKNGELSAVGCEATEDNNNVQYVDNIAPEN